MTSPIEEFEAQPTLQPGEAGWWKVWGASVTDIRPGDIVCVASDDDPEGVDKLFIEDTFAAKASGLRVGIVINGERQTLGRLCPIVLFRRETHHTLAGSVR